MPASPSLAWGSWTMRMGEIRGTKIVRPPVPSPAQRVESAGFADAKGGVQGGGGWNWGRLQMPDAIVTCCFTS